MIKRAISVAILLSCTGLAAFVAGPTGAQTVAAPAASVKTADTTTTDVGALAWLDGCWGGTVNQRDFREQWSPLR